MIAQLVNSVIAHNKSTALAGASNIDIKQLWGLLKHSDNWGANKQTVSNIGSNQINDYFANIATDPDYDHSAVIKATRRALRHIANFVKYTRYSSFELILARIRKTSSGTDELKAIKNCTGSGKKKRETDNILTIYSIHDAR